MYKKLLIGLFALLFLSLPVASLLRYWITPAPMTSPGPFARPGDVTDEAIRSQYPFSYPMKKLHARMEYAGGHWEQDGIFYTQGRLIENLTKPPVSFTSQNTSAILQYTASQNFNALFALLPTACAVDQEVLPPLAVPHFDQRTYLERVTHSLPRNLLFLDVYPTLFANREQKQFYNSDPAFTPLGGYSIYTALCERLGLAAHPLTDYSVENVNFNFSGALHRRLPYFEIKPDILSLYRLQSEAGQDARFTVERVQNDGSSVLQEGLYDTAMLETDDPLQIYLGEAAPMAHIYNEEAVPQTLLLFGDDTARSYLPFLAAHFSKITWINLEKISPELLKSVAPREYDSALFCYSISTYLGSNEITNLAFSM